MTPLRLAQLASLLWVGALIGVARIAGGGDPEPALAQIETPLDARPVTVGAGETALGNLVADAVAEAARQKDPAVDLALVNASLLGYDRITARAGVLRPGGVSSTTVRELVAYDDRIRIVEMSGETMMSILKRALSRFPAPWGGFLHPSTELRVRATVAERSILPLSWAPLPPCQLQSMLVSGRAVDPSARYRIAVSSFMTRRSSPFREIAGVESTDGGSVREALSGYLTRRQLLRPHVDGRIRINPAAASTRDEREAVQG
jgi:hypothetical protein